MPALSASPAEPRVSSRRVAEVRQAGATAIGGVLIAESVGHQVPRSGFTGRVHSVFARSCNLVWGDLLLTLSTTPTDGPTVIRLAAGVPMDLRSLFHAGERVTGGRSALRTPRAEIGWLHARTWRPDAPRPSLPRAAIVANLQHAERGLAQYRSARPNALDGAAAAVIAALRRACAAVDITAAPALVTRLIGWGEGLTPAGDDFLIGLLAGLDALPTADAPRRECRAAVASTVMAQRQRTTPIAAHSLRLAAAGHHAAPLLDLRQALLADADLGRVDRTMRAALAIGATSGADTVSGLLAGLAAWVAPAGLDRR
jgi:Protein of unknown function (DUF2877)